MHSKIKALILKKVDSLYFIVNTVIIDNENVNKVQLISQKNIK